MNSRDRILAAFNLEQPDRIPFAEDIPRSVRELLMGKKDFTDIEFAKKIGMDALDLQPHPYYAPNFCDKKIVDGHEYMLGGRIKTEKDLDLVKLPDPKDESFYDPVKRFVDEYGKEDFATFAYMSWGVEGVLNSMGIEAFSFALFDQPKLVESLLDRYSEWNCIIMEKLNTVGLDFISTYNNMAYNTGPMFSPQTFREVFLPKMKEVADTCKLPWVFHGDGNLMPIMDDIVTLGMNCLHPIEPGAMDLKYMKDTYGDKICLWGNVDMNTLSLGTPEEVEEEVKACIEAAGAGGGYILGSSNCITDYCKPENVWAMAEAIKKYGVYEPEKNLKIV
ncbi:Uroporphyrinogen decarboxylase (URO-D) [Dethiosulfatibacter aminovorans DSM 17477]|uniref:Uroporphyrinogen decarboxylase (URO-D) n=1 Tax=Dethiosulfatibacter aminovorans DSM 17477 TaxID=1121476 RepID=A0A1M6NC53_9FIRM|nr:uroporphyrinogen decarboxylase family protein [Dethiosulfatibacter aminovorans]SHJ93310.1 Uroporphyrinogen decarboxylase (URO-D) [Dethiosulfatibacter aminovorans DSM 17477]